MAENEPNPPKRTRRSVKAAEAIVSDPDSWKEKRYDVFFSFHGSEKIRCGGDMRNAVANTARKIRPTPSVFLDSARIPERPDQSISNAVYEAILSTQGGGLCIALVTSAYLQNRWTQIELACFFALRRNVKLIIILVGVTIQQFKSNSFTNAFLCEDSHFDLRYLHQVPPEKLTDLEVFTEFLRLKVIVHTKNMVLGTSQSESYADLKEKLNNKLTVPGRQSLANRLGAKNSSSAFKIFEWFEQNEINEDNVDKLITIFEDFSSIIRERKDCERIVKAYREKWLGEWSSKSQVDVRSIAAEVSAWHEQDRHHHVEENLLSKTGSRNSQPSPTKGTESSQASQDISDVDDFPKYREITKLDVFSPSKEKDSHANLWDYLAKSLQVPLDPASSACIELRKVGDIVFYNVPEASSSNVDDARVSRLSSLRTSHPSHGHDVALENQNVMPRVELFHSALARRVQYPIIVVGDIMLDVILNSSSKSPRAHHGDIDYVAPAQTFELGGAARVAKMIRRLGQECYLFGVVGLDPLAEIVQQLLDDEGIHRLGVVPDAGRPTTTKYRCENERSFSSTEQSFAFRVDVETCQPISGEIEEILVSMIKQQMITNSEGVVGSTNLAASGIRQLVVVADYAKGVVTTAISEAICAADNVAVIAESKPRKFHPETKIAFSMMQVSQAELAELKIDHPRQWIASTDWLEHVRKKEIPVLVTSGADGAHYCIATHSVYIPPLVDSQMSKVQALGPGDCLLAGAAVAILHGVDSLQACVFGSLASALYCTRPWNDFTFTNVGDKIKLLQAKIVTVPEVQKILDQKRSAGRLQVIATAGRFDALHWNHFKFLKRSKYFGDILITFIITENKPKQPYLCSVGGRALMVATVPYVDYVVLVDENLLGAAIRSTKPNIFVKGTNALKEKSVDLFTNKLDDLRGSFKCEIESLETFGGVLMFLSSGPFENFYSKDIRKRRTSNSQRNSSTFEALVRSDHQQNSPPESSYDVIISEEFLRHKKILSDHH